MRNKLSFLFNWATTEKLYFHVKKINEMLTYHVYTYKMLNDANDIWRQTSICEEYSLDRCSWHKSKSIFL